MTLGYFAHWPVFTDLSRVNWLNHVNVFVFSHCFLFFKSLIHNKNILACCMRYNRTMDRCVFEHTNVQLNIIKRLYMFVNAFKVFNSSSSKRHFCWIFFSSTPKPPRAFRKYQRYNSTTLCRKCFQENVIKYSK